MSYVSWRVYGTSHDDDLFDTKERLWIFRCSDGEIGQWSNCDNGDGVGLVLCQNLQHHLVSRLERWREE